MRSASILDERASAANAPKTRDLLVLWQHPETREIVPIGRFVHDGETYWFTYTRAAASTPDFRPLPGLNDLRSSYRSQRIPVAFEQRVMEPDRPDYAAYLDSIGLDPAHATPWEQIVESGGTRAGDTLQFMQIPVVSHGRAIARFLANGVRHVPNEARTIRGRTVHVSAEEHEAALRSLAAGDSVLVEPEEDNPEDDYACLVTTDGIPLGWVPRALSASIRELMSSGPVSATVARVGRPGTLPHLRLVLDLDVPAPPSFEFDRDGSWEPLTSQ